MCSLNARSPEHPAFPILKSDNSGGATSPPTCSRTAHALTVLGGRAQIRQTGYHTICSAQLRASGLHYWRYRLNVSG